MSDTVNELYLKYAKLGPVLEEDRYFQYLYEAIQSGRNVLDQQSVVIHKTVDEEWLGFIESKIDSVFNVIQKPRRFIKSSEEIVPVDLARKITADSVRHLAQNTQFIVNNEDGDVRPTKVLNVTSEETYDLYENRFIYYLIQKLIRFVDKRTDVIFWSTGDESYNTLKFSSRFSDENEDVEYELSMRVGSKEDVSAEGRAGMDVYMRIDRLRRLIMQLRRSSFCELMAGCAKVRSPIQRTNLIMKDHDYKDCFMLWQFLERYDAVGYTVSEEKKALQFDEEYLIQFYSSFIANYACFKSILEPDRRDILKSKRKLARKPKFLKTVKEEYVDSPKLEDVEIRRVFVEYVTKAQLEAEARAAEAESRAELALAKASEAERAASEADRLRAEAEACRDGALKEKAAALEARKAAEEQAAGAFAAAEKSEALMRAALFEKDEAVTSRDTAIKERAAALEFAKRAAADAQRRGEEAARRADELVSQAGRERDAAVAAAVRDKDAAIERSISAAQTKIKETTRRANDIIEKTVRDAQDRISREMSEARRLAAQARSEMQQAEKLRLYSETRIGEAESLALEAESARAEAEKLTKKADKLVQQKIAKVRGLTFAEYLALRFEARRSGKS